MGEKLAWRGEWRNAISGKQMDNVRKEIHVESLTNAHLETKAREDEKNNRPLQRLKRRHRLTLYSPKVQAVKVKALLGREAEYHAKIFLDESARIRHVTCGTLPCVAITSLNPDARMVKNVNSEMQQKVEEIAGKGSVALLKESIQLGCVSHDSYLRKPILRKERKLGSNHTVKFSKVTWRHIQIREIKGIIQRCEPHERSPCAPTFAERTQDETLHQEHQARGVAMEFGEKCLQAQKKRRKQRFTLLLKPRKQKKW